MHGIT